MDKLNIKNHNESRFGHKIKRSLYALNQVRSEIGPWLRGFLNLSNRRVHVPQSVNKLIQESTTAASEIKINRSWSATNSGFSRNRSLI